MPNALAHRTTAAAVVGGIALATRRPEGEPDGKPLFATGLAWLSGTLPDVLEPARGNPNHRRIFHSLTVACGLSYGLYRAWQWEPETDAQKWLRVACLALGGAYIVHLAMDPRTPKGLPVL